MGSSRGNCEIIEAKDELNTIRRPQTLRQVRPQQDREQKPPILRKAHNKSLEDDINKLFEAVNLRASKSLDLSDWPRNASKKPMRSAGSQSPGIGFYEPVSLKQALRGLCISQAAEMAAVKRLSMPASPRISEAGKATNSYRSVGCSPLTEESTSYSSETLTRTKQDSFKKAATKSSCSSPSYIVKPNVKNVEFISSESRNTLAECVGISRVEGENTTYYASNLPRHVQEPTTMSSSQSARSSPHEEKLNLVSKPDEKISGPIKVASGSNKDSAVNKAAPKLRHKSKLQTVPSSGSVKSNKDVKSTKNTSRTIKPVIRNKNLVIKKPKKAIVPTDGGSKTPNEVSSGPNESSAQLICQKCQCSLRDTSKDSPVTNSAEAFTGSKNCDSNKSDSIPTSWENGSSRVVKTNTTSKGDISQSSKSSICDFSSSTTSLSEDSSLSGSTCGNRPHMSKDMRWGVMNRIRKQYGFLGLSHFNLLKKLGSGDIGTVYLAELIGTNCAFAIKVMDNEFLAKRKKMPRAQTEREILRMLDHPFLPTLYAQFTSDNLSCLVMEFCPGGDLHVLRQKQPGRYFPEQAARFYVAEVLLALEYLHMLGIVYRDLKPENILVREDGHIMLTDFDLSLRCSVNPTLVKSSSLNIEPPRMSGPCAGSNCIDPFCAGPSCKVSCFSPRIFPASARTKKLKAEAAAQARSLPQLVAEPTEARSNSFVGTHEYLAPEIIKGTAMVVPLIGGHLVFFCTSFFMGRHRLKALEMKRRWRTEDKSNMLRILVATDCHLGYMEKDEIRRHDSFQAFEEICSIAEQKQVDFILLGGDLFHENKPSRSTLVKAIEILRRHCLNDRPVQFQVVSDQTVNFANTFGHVNYEDPHFNVGLPVFSIHGNHDDPAGVDNLSAVDILSACNLVNYFGKMVLEGSGVGEITLYPILVKKTPHAVQWMRPEAQDGCKVSDWFNILVLHQNR
ncbi:hypothetical protein DH2020_018074 [Rehmannia glutinosa]|uniref:non-specific serine/threonine protein kinase n=1 Tax=Rehmannia glutinosa TaxID=99300 RepID=A0ABR0WLF0_REHGL